MEKTDGDKSSSSDESSQLSRNRSFKSKQLVRSQAIRESQSPPRVSPAPPETTPEEHSSSELDGEDQGDVQVYAKKDDGTKKATVEIQITGGWEHSEQRQRARRWAGQRPGSRDLLTHGPRLTCVCGVCGACPHCRGRRRKNVCPTKQDSGISDDCADCSDSETGGATNGEVGKKADSFDAEEHYYCRCPERKEKPKSTSFSRTESDEKSEPTGVDLVNFIKETLNKNARDRMTLLKIEKELHSLVTDTGRCIVRFPVMTSYGRMLVHRCAALFQLSHHLDQSNKTSVLVSKSGTSGGRLPCTSFRAWCTAAFPPSPHRHAPTPDTHAKSILKRESLSSDGGNGAGVGPRSRSLEQREKDYERVRRRIFSNESNSQDEAQWPWLGGGPVKLLTPEHGRNKLLKVQSLEGSGGGVSASRRGVVAKSNSFGGYSGDTTHPPHRLLSRHGDLAASSWRVSPSSSGYRTLSLHSADSVTPSPTGGASPEPGVCGDTVVWCVSALDAVPRGAVLIHPQTGRPLTNPDGSVYQHDPENPPALATAYNQEPKMDECIEKRRGRLEKQHSFVDSECGCATADGRACCCDCRVRPQSTPQKEHKMNQKPTSPCKNRHEPEPTNNNTEPTNHRPPYEPPTNQTPAIETTNRNYEPPTNQRQAYERQYETTNQRQERPPSFENRTCEVNRVVNVHQQNGQEAYVGQQIYQRARHEEPPAESVKLNVPPPVDMNLRPVSLSGVLYPAPAQYHYVNQCRLEQTAAPLYQSIPMMAEDKQLGASHHHGENTFRIDPSYPYPLEYAAGCPPCAACSQPAAQQHRPVSVPYGAEQLQYPMAGMMMPPAHMTYPTLVPITLTSQYGEQVWMPQQLVGGPSPLIGPPGPLVGAPGPLMGASPKLYLPELMPIMHYPAQLYPPYNLMYQQPPVMPPYSERPHTASYQRRPSNSGSARVTPLQTPPDDKKVPYEPRDSKPEPQDGRQDSAEIAAKIQQIKEQMVVMNTRDNRKSDEWKRRNSGPHGPTNDETQLSSAARAIVNSIRNMQAKNNYVQPRRYESPRRRPDEAPRPHLIRQMPPGTWCRRSPGPVHPVMNHPRRPHPDPRNPRR